MSDQDQISPNPDPPASPPTGPATEQSWWERVKPQVGVCANCGRSEVQEFCPNCGQRHADERLTMRGLARELPSRYVSLDRGFLRTFLDLSTRPGEVCFDYVSGKRRKYANPFAYFLVAATVQLISLTILRSRFLVHTRDQLAKQTVNGEHPMQELFDKLGDNGIEIFAGMTIDLTRSAYSYLWIFFAVVFAFTVWLLPFMGKRRFNLPETTIYSIYSFAHILILLGVAAPLGIPLLGFTAWIWIVWSSYFLYLSWSAVQFFKGGNLSFVGAAIGLAVAFVSYLFVFIVLLFLWIGIRIATTG